jgi:hypothetical protein
MLIILFAASLSLFCYSSKISESKFRKFSWEDGLEFLKMIENLGFTKLSELSDDESRLLFVGYKHKYSKLYGVDADMEKRYKIFKKNLLLIDTHNAEERLAGGTAIHGITKFSDMEHSEFLATLSARPPNIFLKGKSILSNAVDSMNTFFNDFQKSDSDIDGDYEVDWSGKYTTPIRDQGQCGGCWAFSTVSQIESDAIRLNLWSKSEYLSAQQLISCAKEAKGCNGGWTEVGVNYVSEVGVVPESFYPYTDSQGKTSPCELNEIDTVLSISDAFVIENGEQGVLRHITSTGPLSVCIDGTKWLTYTSGIMKSCGKSVNHCVQLVGASSKGKYWKVKLQYYSI